MISGIIPFKNRASEVPPFVFVFGLIPQTSNIDSDIIRCSLSGFVKKGEADSFHNNL